MTDAAEKNDKTPEAVELLSSLFKKMEGLDKNQPGYAHNEGWNAALRYAMDIIRAQPRSSGLNLTLTRTLGLYGAAYDPPGPSRAYTYQHQPNNGPAYNLGCAASATLNRPAGDTIDVGLILLRELEARGFGVFETVPWSPS